MTARSQDAVTKEDLDDYLANSSDFAFELRVLKCLTDKALTCRHGESYVDPITGKDRTFDIRASWQDANFRLALAVECKNLRQNYPLLIHCVPRTTGEAFHDVSAAVDGERLEYSMSRLVTPRPHCKVFRREGASSLYKSGDPVGKSCVQVGSKSDSTKKPSDADIYDKWSQAISSLHDLTYSAATVENGSSLPLALTILLPVLVVPDERMWVVEYDASGGMASEPRQVDRCSYYVNKSYWHDHAYVGEGLAVSHLEFVTQRGLVELIDMVAADALGPKKLFALDVVKEHVSTVGRPAGIRPGGFNPSY